MNLHDLLERRRNPELNPRISEVDFLRQFKDDPTMYLHTTNIPKVGIYPKSSFGLDSPAGIYAYRLADIWEDTIERWNTGEYRRGLEFLPYHGGDHLFVLESNIDPDFPGHYSEDDLARDVEKLKQIYGLSDGRIERLHRTAQTNQNFQDCPAGYLWGMTKALVAGVSEFDAYTPVNTRLWNAVLRNLGYVGFNDPGMSLIHGAESSQAVFLTTSAFRVVDSMNKNRRQRLVIIGDKEYKGGRLPKNLFMDGIPNTLFHNYEPADFAKVHSWTVRGIDIHDLPTFMRFVPWNGVGIVQTLAIGTAANESYELSSVRRFFEQYPTLPKHIKIENIYVGTRMPVMLIKMIPESFPFNSITISQFATDVGLDRLPSTIRAKIKVHR